MGFVQPATAGWCARPPAHGVAQRDARACHDLALDTEPLLLIASSQTDPGVTPLPVDSTGIPNDHLEYAITWFSLAAVWVAMTGAFLWRSRATAKA